MITSRGPLCTAGFVRNGTTEFMIDLVEDPKGAHKLIDLCTRVIIDWLKAQQKVMGDGVEKPFSFLMTLSASSTKASTTWSLRTPT